MEQYREKLKVSQRITAIAALILACLIAFSRLYLYVHYPTDVLFSVVVGFALALLGDRLSRRIPDRYLLLHK